MKKLLAILLIVYSPASVPEQKATEWWREWNLGAPCTTETDRIEGTCNIDVKWKPTWQK